MKAPDVETVKELFELPHLNEFRRATKELEISFKEAEILSDADHEAILFESLARALKETGGQVAESEVPEEVMNQIKTSNPSITDLQRDSARAYRLLQQVNDSFKLMNQCARGELFVYNEGEVIPFEKYAKGCASQDYCEDFANKILVKTPEGSEVPYKWLGNIQHLEFDNLVRQVNEVRAILEANGKPMDFFTGFDRFVQKHALLLSRPMSHAEAYKLSQTAGFDSMMKTLDGEVETAKGTQNYTRVTEVQADMLGIMKIMVKLAAPNHPRLDAYDLNRTDMRNLAEVAGYLEKQDSGESKSQQIFLSQLQSRLGDILAEHQR